MNDQIKFYVLIIVVLFICKTQAQISDYHFDNFSSTQRLPHYSINHLLEDDYGFLWFATNSGLFRYDGYSLKSYLHNVEDSTSISSPGVEFVVEDQKGQIWASTLYGINLFDRRTGTFTRYCPFPEDLSTKGNNFIRELFVDCDDRLFALGNENLYLFDQKNKAFIVINDRKYSTQKHRPRSITGTTNGTIWCTAETGLLKISPGESSYTFVQLDTTQLNGLNKGIYVVSEGDDNQLWVFTSKGLVLFHPEELSVTENLLPAEFQSQKINTLTKIRNGKLLIGFENNGLGVFSSKFDFKHYTHDDDRFNSLQSNKIRCIVEDQFENIWLGTAAGISKITVDHSGFELIQNRSGLDQRANNVNRVHKDRQGTIWMNTELGIYSKSIGDDFGKPMLLNIKLDKTAQADFIYEDSLGNLIIAMVNNGLWQKTKNSTRFERIPLDKSLQNIQIFEIIADSKEANILWLGTSKGLCKLNKVTFEYNLFKPLDQHPTQKSNQVSVFSEYGDDIWFYYTYSNSIGRFNKQDEKFELIRAPKEDQYILEGVFRDMAVTPDGNVWFATNYGLGKYNVKDRAFEIYTKKEGLLDNDLNAVVIDKNNQLWVTGQKFIAKFDAKKYTFNSYEEPKNVKKFLSRSAYLSDDGQLLFGCLNGVFAFYPDSIKNDLIAPNIILTDFKVGDNTFLLDNPFENTTNIKLRYDQNDISFGFSGIHYIDPKAIQYRCLLEGYDNKWRYLGNDHYVSYTNLSPGQFKLKLNACNKDGVWNEKETSIDILITPPFYQTNWFRSLLFLTLISLIYIILRSRQKRILLHAQKEFAEKSAAYKTQFLADVSHEIRTPMNAIIGLSKLTLETKLDKKQRSFIDAIQESSKNLLSIINDLLDHTKLEAGKFTFVNKAFDLNDITRMLRNTFNYIAKEKELDFEVNINYESSQKIVGDPIRLNQILTNLLGNAIKFTESGKVWFSIDKQEESDQNIKLKFEVGDSGIGIAKDKLEMIFESFIQAEGGINKGMEGTGLGLSIAQQMVEKQGGRLFIESKLGEGTKLWFDLTFQKIQIDNASQPKAKKDFTIDTLNVLVVEDTYFNQMLVVEILKKHIKAPKIIIASNGKIALEKLKDFKFDIILMDVKMQVMDGFEATKIIRSLDDVNIKHIPILAVTASAVSEQLDKCKAAGMNDYVTKPIDENELIEKIYSLTKNISI